MKNVNLIPNVSPISYSTSAFIIGLLLAEDLTPAEQNSLGNWFMMIGQSLCTYASQQQLLNNRNSNNTSHIINDDNLKDVAYNLKNNINNLFTEH